LLKNMSLVSIGITVSRVLGYAREMLLASVLGAGFFADAFFAAFRIPNLFRRLFGESSLNAAFVPVFSAYASGASPDETRELLNAMATVMTVALGVLTLTGVLAAHPAVRLITWGFEPEKLELTGRLLRIMFPFVWVICLAALGLSALNCLGVFFVPAASSASLSIIEIIYLAVVWRLMPADLRVEGLAAAVVLGGLLQMTVNFLVLRYRGFPVRFRPRRLPEYLRGPEIRRVALLFVPVVLGFSIDQVNALVDMLCASFLAQGSVSVLHYSGILMQLPLALFGTALITVTLPQMSREAACGSTGEMCGTLGDSLRNILFFMVPSALGLVLLGKPIIRVFYERGAFTPGDSALTYRCLVWYAAGLVFFALSKSLVSAFYALRMPRIPVAVAGMCLCANAVLNVLLMRVIGVAGLALATTISSALACVLLYASLRRRVDRPFGEAGRLGRFLLRLAAAAVILSVFLLACRVLLHDAYVAVAIGVPLGALLYGSAAVFLHMEEAGIMLSFARRLVRPATPDALR